MELRMSNDSRDPGTMQGIDKPDDTGVAENTNNTDWDLSAMSAAHIEGSEYRILSTRNNSVTHYRVDVDAGECECPSTVFNLDEYEACPHLTKALTVHTSHMTADQWAVRDLQMLSERLHNILWELRDVAEQTAADSDTDAADADPPEETEHGVTVSNPEARAAAEDLREAYDGLIDDMQVQHHAGKVWIQTGQDTPENWPYPGGSETWSVLLKAPEQVEFVGEGGDGYDPHPLYDEKPGEYWRNIIDPDDVDEYIQEVLE